MGIVDISIGGLSETLADPKVIFAIALKSGANGVIMAHNHPSEELQPGKENLKLTEKLRQGAKLIDIEILDHLIVSQEAFTVLLTGLM